MADKYTILNASGPFREPRELTFSYDYSFQRPTWPSPFAIRIKVSIPEELDPLRSTLLGNVQGTPGQQLVVTNLLSRRIADQKLVLANEAGLLNERQDVMISSFAGSLAPLAKKLEEWFSTAHEELREEIRLRAKL
ncbi:hypothetical protein YTPLAS18_11520 [Nitrospira sp.]|nr:hypothetical protein YTPLAS18_11520 [Nitrospira sp.]